MRFMKPMSRRLVIPCGLALGLIASLTASAAEQAEPKEATVGGRYVSFQDGVLKIKVQDLKTDVWSKRQWKVADDTKVVTHIRGVSKDSTAREVFKAWESGAVTAIHLQDDKVAFVEIGIKQAQRRRLKMRQVKHPKRQQQRRPTRPQKRRRIRRRKRLLPRTGPKVANLCPSPMESWNSSTLRAEVARIRKRSRFPPAPDPRVEPR